MIRIVKLAVAFAAMLFLLPIVAMADDYGYDDKEPLGVIDIYKNKCLYFPDKNYKNIFLETYKIKFVKYGYDKKVFCFFPLYNHSYLDDEDGFKCVIGKFKDHYFKIFKRTYDSFFEVKYNFAILGCKFRDKHDYDY